MTQIPTQTNLTAAITLYDDLVKVHQLLYWIIHHTGWFLPYHRLYFPSFPYLTELTSSSMTHTHETLLRTYCNYTGAQPYWNESPDAGSFRNSTTLNSFGGPGGPDTCVDQAPFAGIPLHIGPGFENQDHCIFRNISETASAGTSYTSVQRCMDRSLPGPTLLSDSTLDTTANTAAYESFWHCLEGAPHAGGHNGVGGGMQDAVASPGDPLFWLHHAWIDKIWYDWQVQNERRGGFEALAGYRTMEEPVDGWVNVTVGDVMPMFGLVGDRTIESVMRPETELCYTYVEAKANVARREALAAQAAQSGRA